MPPRIKQLGKVLTSGVLFSLLGLGGCLCTLVVRPALAILPGGREGRRRRAQGVIRRFFRLFVFGLEASGILKVLPSGLPEPGDLRGAIVLANHPSYLDIVILLTLLPDAVCVVKEGVWKNLFFGGLVQAAGFISNQDPGEVLDACGQALASGRTLVIFPEGSRTRPGKPLKFHRGAAHLALRTGAPVYPFTIRVAPPLLAKGDRWYDVPVQTCLFRIISGLRLEWMKPEGDDPGFLRGARVLTGIMERHYLEEQG